MFRRGLRLQTSLTEVLLVELVTSYHPDSQAITLFSGRPLNRQSLLRYFGATCDKRTSDKSRLLIDSLFDCVERLHPLLCCSNDLHQALFAALLVITSERFGLREMEMVKRINLVLVALLDKSLRDTTPPAQHASLVECLRKESNSIRQISILHSQLVDAGPPQSAQHRLSATCTQNLTAAGQLLAAAAATSTGSASLKSDFGFVLPTTSSVTLHPQLKAFVTPTPLTCRSSSTVQQKPVILQENVRYQSLNSNVTSRLLTSAPIAATQHQTTGKLHDLIVAAAMTAATAKSASGICSFNSVSIDRCEEISSSTSFTEPQKKKSDGESSGRSAFGGLIDENGKKCGGISSGTKHGEAATDLSSSLTSSDGSGSDSGRHSRDSDRIDHKPPKEQHMAMAEEQNKPQTEKKGNCKLKYLRCNYNRAGKKVNGGRL